MAELADARDLKSLGALPCTGSNPVSGINHTVHATGMYQTVHTTGTILHSVFTGKFFAPRHFPELLIRNNFVLLFRVIYK